MRYFGAERFFKTSFIDEMANTNCMNFQYCLNEAVCDDVTKQTCLPFSVNSPLEICFSFGYGIRICRCNNEHIMGVLISKLFHFP